MPVLLKNVLDDARKLFVLSLDLGVHIFIFWVIKWEVHRKPFCALKSMATSRRTLVRALGAVSQSRCVYGILLLLERTTDKLGI